MTIRSSFKKALAVLIAGGVLSVGGTSAAQAQVEVEYLIGNGFGTTLTRDTWSCTGGLSLTPPITIAAGDIVNFGGWHPSLSSTLCNVRYRATVSGVTYGCQFQIWASSWGGGWISANAYQGAGGSPQCVEFDYVTEPGYTGGIFIQQW